MKTRRLQEILETALERGGDRDFAIEVWINDEIWCDVTHVGVYSHDGPTTVVVDRNREVMRVKAVIQALSGLGDNDVEFVYKNVVYGVVERIGQFSVIPDVAITVKQNDRNEAG